MVKCAIWADCHNRIDKLEREKTALLEALEWVVYQCRASDIDLSEARAAIALAREERA